MKQIVRILSVTGLIVLLSGCGVFESVINVVSNTMTEWQQSPNASKEQKAIAEMWNTGGAGSKITATGAAIADGLALFGVKGAGDVQKIQETTQNAVFNTKTTGNETADLIIAATYYGGAIADHFISKKKNADFEEYAAQHREQYTADPDSPYYDPYYDYRWEIDYEKRTIRKRDSYEFNTLRRENERQESLADKRRELIVMGVLTEDEYNEFFEGGLLLEPLTNEQKKYLSQEELAEEIKRREEAQDLYREYVAKLTGEMRRNGYIPGTYNQGSKTFKTIEDFYPQAETPTCSSGSNTDMQENLEELPNASTVISEENYTQIQDETISEPSQISEISTALEQVNLARFAFNTIALTQSQKSELDELLKILEGKDVTICVTGHTCSIGTDKANYNVGLKRAEAAKKYLVDKGVSESQIVVASAGASMPIASNDTVEGRGENRRISFAVQQ